MTKFLKWRTHTTDPSHLLTEDSEQIYHQETTDGDRLIEDLPSINQIAPLPYLSGTENQSIPISVSEGSTNQTYKASLPDLVALCRKADSSTNTLEPGFPVLSGSEEVSVVQESELKKVKTAALGAGERLNIKEMGARGDGINNDAHIINLAINSVSTRTREIYFPPGEYRIEEPITIGSGGPIRLRGAGPEYTKIKIEYNPAFSDYYPVCTVLFSSTVYGNSIIGMTIVGKAVTRSALCLYRQGGFRLQDVRIEGGSSPLYIIGSYECNFKHLTVHGGPIPHEPAARKYLPAAQIWAGHSLSFENSIFENGEGHGVNLVSCMAFFESCCFRNNNSHGIMLDWNLPATSDSPALSPVLYISQCNFEKNQGSAIGQSEPDWTYIQYYMLAKIVMTDSTIVGPAETVKSLIDVSYCDLDIRNSPAHGGRYDYYLKLPEYGLKTVPPRSVSMNIENHGYMKIPDKIDDPSGVVTGTVRRFYDNSIGKVVTEISQNMELKQCRALRVEELDDEPEDEILRTDDIEKHRTWAFRVDLEEGGVKTLHLDRLLSNSYTYDYRFDQCTMEFKNPRPVGNLTLRPVNGQEIDIILLNEMSGSSGRQIRFYFPDNFLYDLDKYPVNPISIDQNQSKLASFIFLENILLLRTPNPLAFPAIGQSVELTVVVGPRSKGHWKKVVASGRLIYEQMVDSDMLYYLDLNEGGEALNLYNQGAMWLKYPVFWPKNGGIYNQFNMYQRSLKLNIKGGNDLVDYIGPSDPTSPNPDIPKVSGCWIQTS